MAKTQFATVRMHVIICGDKKTTYSEQNPCFSLIIIWFKLYNICCTITTQFCNSGKVGKLFISIILFMFGIGGESLKVYWRDGKRREN